jgi:CRP-like cAMP-binding protein
MNSSNRICMMSSLTTRRVVAAAGGALRNAYFPHSGIISLVVRLIHGDITEVAMIGRDSVFGASAALVGPMALTTAIVQSPGMSSGLPIKCLKTAADQSRTFSTTPVRHEQAVFVQARQPAGCMASHAAMARLARWLLRARDATGSDDLLFTQEFLGQMLGVQRNAVSCVATTLKETELIKFSRARIQILDVAGLKATACERYDTVKSELEQLKRSTLH